MKNASLFLTAFVCWSLIPAAALDAQDAAASYSPPIAPKSNEGRLAMDGFQLPTGFTVRLFAAEPMLANPVAFCFDERGRIYVCETFRQEKGVEDNRNHMNWLHDDLALQTVEERLEMFKKHLGDEVQRYTIEHDRLRLIEDRDGDGVADGSTVFADGFNGVLEGTGAGVLARRGDVFYTCIPKLWKLNDRDRDGVADRRTALHHGFGVRVAFRGHDLHGLTMGPDGRIYFSVGDRGFNVLTGEGKRLALPETGAVFRCEPDGSRLEVFATGLRNPQELTFDDFGNLFTADNNSDSGDKARLVYIPEGADFGWRMHYQYLPDRGPWNREMIWYPHNAPSLDRPGPGNVPAGAVADEMRPAFTVPPVANIADGPSGLAYYPGVGLPERYGGHFFLADFRGTSGISGIRSFAAKADGAFFKLADAHRFIWRILATDVDFGYDGNLYVLDWVDGWEGPGKGRIYSFAHPESVKQAREADSGRLMREGFDHRTVQELAGLLEHPDRRIRQEAQFALAARKPGEVSLTLLKVTLGNHRLAALHAVWALGQLARRDPQITRHISSLWFHSDPEVRAQATRVFADALALHRGTVLDLRPNFDERLCNLLADDSPRVRHFAALAAGKSGRPRCIAPLQKMLAENNGRDPVLRHAGVMGLTGIGRRDLPALLDAADHPHKSARMGVLLALRRLKRPEIARFLRDPAPALVVEAARAIHDIPIDEAMSRLADLSCGPEAPDALLRRVLNANFRLGKKKQVEAVIAVAGDDKAAEDLRLEALAGLLLWDQPPPIDRVTGAWRPLEPRSADGLVEVIRNNLESIFSGSHAVRRAGAELAAKYKISAAGPILYQIAVDDRQAGSLRVEALQALEVFGDSRLPGIAEVAVGDEDPAVRAEGRRLMVAFNPRRAVDLLNDAVQTGTTFEKQQAIDVLASMNARAADAVLMAWIDRLIAREVPAEIQLDLINAGKRRNSAEFNRALEQFDRTRPQNDPLAGYREALAGGNSERGREIFFSRAETSCRRCHKVDGEGGEVGPDLSAIGSQKDREYLLEALVLPNKQIAKGYDTVVLAMLDGRVYSGIIKADDGRTLQLVNDKGERIILAKSEIDEQAKGKSPMPEDLVKQLSKVELRDLVEYLASLKEAASTGGRETGDRGRETGGRR